MDTKEAKGVRWRNYSTALMKKIVSINPAR